LTILQISDLHFGAPFVPPVAAALLESARDLAPELIVASGDFTQDGTEAEFTAAAEYLASLPTATLVVTPGNHDVPPLWRRWFWDDPFRSYRKHLRADLDYAIKRDAFAVVSLNSTTWFGSMRNGRLSAEQLRFAGRSLAGAAPSAVRIVVAHHHFAPAPGSDISTTLGGARQAIDCFLDLEVELILGGHLHRAYLGNTLDFYPSYDRRRGITIVQCGTSTSQRGRGREREKNTFNVIRVDDLRVAITHYMYFSERGGFAPISEHFFPRARAPFLADRGLAAWSNRDE
jgi:3',5'-cyclic AMP phosphodiesterase CpdA